MRACIGFLVAWALLRHMYNFWLMWILRFYMIWVNSDVLSENFDEIRYELRPSCLDAGRGF